jgi:hypothetical protein
MKSGLDHLPPHERQQILEVAARVRACAAVGEQAIVVGALIDIVRIEPRRLM